MSLEAGTYINDLVATNPDGAVDPKSAGDNHLRLLKAVLKATFPGMAGAALRVQSKSGDYNPVLNDNLSALYFTAVATLVPTSAVTLGNGWGVFLTASSGIITITPSGGQTINGGASSTIASGGSALLLSNGANFFLLSFDQTASPAFTGTPTAPTAAPGTDTTQIATTAFVQAALTAFQDNLAADSTLWSGAAKTVSTSAPSGGANGDIWFQY